MAATTMSPYDGATGAALLAASPGEPTPDEHAAALAYLRRKDALDLAPFLGLTPREG